jgi:hypothetical protein
MSPAIRLAVLSLLLPGALLAQKERDLSKLDACKVLPATQVASIVPVKLSMPAVGGEVHCEYVLELADKTPETYDIYLYSAELIQMLLDSEDAAGRGKPVPGLWDAAFAGKAVGGPGFRLRAIHKGDMAIELQGPRQEILIKLAKAAITNLH